MAFPIIPALEALGEFLASREAQGLAVDAFMTGARSDLRYAATNFAMGRSQYLEALAERSGNLNKDLGSLTKAAEHENPTLMKDIMDNPTTLKAAIHEGAMAESTVMQDFQSFLKWSASQVWENCLFQVAMDAVDNRLQGGGTDVSPNDRSIVTTTMNALTKALKTLGTARMDWHQWLADHFRKKETYGMVDHNDNLDYRFEVFRRQLKGLTEIVEQKLTPALAGTKSGSVDSYEALKKAMCDYAVEVRKVGEGIKENEPLMVADGLKDHLDEVNAAVADIGGG